MPALHAKLANSPFILSEGGANFWEAFRLVPVGDWFWLDNHLFSVFPVRHSGHRAAFGIALPYDALRDFAFVARVSTSPLMLVTHPGAGLPGVLSSARVLDAVVPHGHELARPLSTLTAEGLAHVRPA